MQMVNGCGYTTSRSWLNASVISRHDKACDKVRDEAYDKASKWDSSFDLFPVRKR